MQQTPTMPGIRIPLSAPLFTEADEAAVLRTLRSGWVSTASPVVKDFEAGMAAWLGLSDSVALNSGTAALHLALRLIDIQPGDEVIVPALTFVATVNPVRYQQAIPVFADIDPKSLAITAETVEPLITPKTKAIMVTHLFGLVADVKALRELADKHGLWLIEDAAEALGARWQGRFAGTWGHIGCFSFNGNKTLTTGSGGLLVCPEFPDWPARARALSAQARQLDSWEVEHLEVGHNYRMNALAAALGTSQLQQLNIMIRNRQAIAKRYAQAFESATPCPGSLLIQSPEVDGAEPSYWFSVLRLAKPSLRYALSQAVEAEGIQLRPVFKPLPLQAPFEPWAKPAATYPNALDAWQRGLCLPCSHWLSEADQQDVINTVLKHYSTLAEY